MAKPKDNLSKDISELRGLQFWEQPWKTKGTVTGGYGSQKLTQPSDAQLADVAFERLGEKTSEPASRPAPQSSAPKAMSDGEMADEAFRRLGK
jgi:hypothetical protein